MVESAPKEEAIESAKALWRPRLLIIRFILGWLSSIVVLAVIGLLINIDWAKPKLETAMGEAIHRKVELGHLRWHFGLNGLTLLTRSVKVNELDGDPFLTARGSNIGLAFTPLLQGKVVVKFAQMDHPEIWAVKLKPGAWNFEDLLVPGVEVRFVQIDSGKVHIRDQSKAAITGESFDLEEVNLKSNWPKKGKNLPVYLSCTLPGQSHLRIDGFGNASDNTFANTVYALSLSTDNLKVQQLKRLLSILADDEKLKNYIVKSNKQLDLEGLIQLKAKLQGSLRDGFKADLNTRIENIIVSTPDMGELKTKSIVTRGDVVFNDSMIGWKNIDFSMGPLQLKTEGELKDWQNKNTTYALDLSSKLADLSSIDKTIDTSQTKKGSKSSQELIKIIKTATLTGKAFFDFKISGDSKEAKILSKLEAEGLPVHQIVKEVAPELAPYLILSGIKPNSIIKGHFESHPGRRISIKGGQISIPDSLIKLEGEIDLLRDAIDVKFTVDELSLKKAWTEAINDPEAMKILAPRIPQADLRSLFIGGFVRAKGDIVHTKHGLSVGLTAQLRDGTVATRDGSIDAHNINGEAILKDNILTLNSVAGRVGSGGKFTLVGGVTGVCNAAPTMNVIYSGKNINFADLSELMTMFGLKFTAITEGHLTGKVKELTAKFTGSALKPQIYFSAGNEDISYKPPGLSRSLRATSGTMVYENDNFELKEVGIISRGMRLTTSVRIENVTRTAELKSVHVKSDGIDIGDIDYYLSSTVLPAPLRKSYRDFLNAYKIKNLHGKIYGDLVVVPMAKDKKNFDLEGVIGCYSVGAKVSKLEVPLERIAGVIAASGDELLIQDLTGFARSTRFDLDGNVKNYKSASPQWKTELRANIAPQEFLDLVPALTTALMNGKIKIASAGPFDLRAKIEGNPTKNSIIFSAHANADDHLKISIPILVINQPNGEALSLDGSMVLTSDGVKLNSTNLLLGTACLKAQGKWMWGSPEQPVSLTVLSQNPVPAKILLGLIDPTFDTKNLSGNLDGFIAVDGPANHPKLTGKVSLDRISNPDYNLYGLTGTVSTDAESQRNSEPYTISVARLDIDHLRLRKLSINDLGGFIKVESPETKADKGPASPRLALKDVTARIAGGLVNMDGYFDLSNHLISFNSDLTQVHMEEISDRLCDAPGELSGTMDGEIHITANGESYKEFISNLKGTGTFTIKDGIVARFGQLQTKLTQANLLEQGILGFNLNNLMQSVVPFRTGEFNELSGRYQIYQGILSIKELRFSGDDLRMWGAGTANLPTNMLTVDIAGTIPRVTKSRLGGMLGDLSRRFTISKMLNTVTFGQLENLPSLPIIGDIASDKPRTFAFKVDALMADAKAITKSIEKSFRWLPNKQAASAHPVPGL